MVLCRAQLQRIATGYASRGKFLTDLTLDPPSAASDEAGPPSREKDYLILSTIHSAKGQEWRSVFVLNVVDGCIPSDLGTGCSDDIEEERCLLYVAMTRAKDQLMLMVPQRSYTHQQSRTGDRHVYAARTGLIPRDCRPLRAAQLAHGPGQSPAGGDCWRAHRRSWEAHARHVAPGGNAGADPYRPRKAPWLLSAFNPYAATTASPDERC